MTTRLSRVSLRFILVCLGALSISACSKFTTQFASGDSTGFTFDGVYSSSNYTLDTNALTVSLSWAPASGGTGQITYLIYSDSKFTTKIAQTTNTSWTSTPLQPGQTYTFGVWATDAAGDIAMNDHTVVINVPVNPLQFKGVGSGDAVLASDDSSISLTWAPATGGTGQITYMIYSDTQFTQQIAQTTNTTWSYTGTISPGYTYIFGVRAEDQSTPQQVTKNMNYVTITVPTKNSGGGTGGGIGTQVGPVFAGAQLAWPMSDTQMLLKWTPCPNELCFYDVYQSGNLTAPVQTLTPDKNYYVVSQISGNNLNAGQYYSFIVRAKSVATGIEEQNTNVVGANLLSNSTPHFAGVSTVERIPGKTGLTTLRVTWVPPAELVAGYRIFIGTTRDMSQSVVDPMTTGLQQVGAGQITVETQAPLWNSSCNNYQLSGSNVVSGPLPLSNGTALVSPIASNQVSTIGTYIPDNRWCPAGNIFGTLPSPAPAPSPLPSISVRISGLTQGTTYYVEVQAFTREANGLYITEQNRIDLSNSTLSLTPAGFDGGIGITSASAVPATTSNPGAPLNSATTTWNLPDVNNGGVYDSIRVDYIDLGQGDATGTNGQLVTPQGQSGCTTAFTGTGNGATPAGAAGAVGTNYYSVLPPEAMSPTGQIATSAIVGPTAYTLTAHHTYEFRVRAVWHTGGDITQPEQFEDSNTSCWMMYTDVPPPVFAGLSSAYPAAQESGFHSFIVNWPPATGSFTNYHVQIVQVMDQNQNQLATPTVWVDDKVGNPAAGFDLTNINTTTATYQLPSNAPTFAYYIIRVAAEYQYGSGSNAIDIQVPSLPATPVTSCSGQASCVGPIELSPVPPGNEGVTQVFPSLANDNVTVNFTKPTNTGNAGDPALYNNFNLFEVCGSSAQTDVDAYARAYIAGKTYTPPSGETTDVSSPPIARDPVNDPSNPPGTTPYTYTASMPLHVGDFCCFEVRAFYSDSVSGETLNSASTSAPVCGSSNLTAPNFSPNIQAFRPPSTAGFTEANVSWTPITNPNDQGNFKEYELTWASGGSSNIVWCPPPALSSNNNPPNPALCNGTTAPPYYDSTAGVYRGPTISLTQVNANTYVLGTGTQANGNPALPENTVITVAIRAVNSLNGVIASSPTYTTATLALPAFAQGDSFAPGASGKYTVDRNSIYIPYTAPPAPSASAVTPGLWNNVVIVLDPNGASDLTSYFTGVQPGGAMLNVPLPADAQKTSVPARPVLALDDGTIETTNVFANLGSSPTVTQTPSSNPITFTFNPPLTSNLTSRTLILVNPPNSTANSIQPGVTQTIRITGLFSNQPIYFGVYAINLEQGAPSANYDFSHFLMVPPASLNTPQSATPTLNNPQFPGTDNAGNVPTSNGLVTLTNNVTLNLTVGGQPKTITENMAGQNSSADFYSIQVYLPAVVDIADCDNVDVVAWDDASYQNYKSTHGITDSSAGNDPYFWTNAPVSQTNLACPGTNSLLPSSLTPQPFGTQPTSETVTLGSLGSPLQTNTLYHVRARARAGGTFSNPIAVSGENKEGLRFTSTTPPTGDGITNAYCNDTSAQSQVLSGFNSGGNPSVTTTCQMANANPALSARSTSPSQPFTAQIQFALPPPAQGVNGTVNQQWTDTYIWKESNSSLTAAYNAVIADAATNSTNTGPVVAPTHDEHASSGKSYWVDSTLYAGGTNTYNCYLARAVNAPSPGQYVASNNTTVYCIAPSYTPPSINGLSSVAVQSGAAGQCPDGTAKLTLTLNGSLGGSIDQFNVYYYAVPNGTTPPPSNLTQAQLQTNIWQVINANDTNFVPASGNTIYAGCVGKTFSGSGYYLLRWVYGPSQTGDTNTNWVGAGATNQAPALTLTAAQSNYTLIPHTSSGLAYDFYMMTYEASLAPSQQGQSNLFSDTDRVQGQSSTNLTTCNTAFHNFSNPATADPSCIDQSSGSQTQFNTTAIAYSVPNATPLTVNWNQAWIACRNASFSDGTLRVRLPTETEWRRAAKWAADQYGSLVSSKGLEYTYTKLCNTGGTALTKTGKNASGSDDQCQNAYGIYDMAGNVREWVDNRIYPYAVPATDQRNYTPPGSLTLGMTLMNGIDGIVRQYQNIIVPPSSQSPVGATLAELMGSGITPPRQLYSSSFDAEAETWRAPVGNGTGATTATGYLDSGFRCVAFTPAQLQPAQGSPLTQGQAAMEKLQLPQEPTYQTGDAPSSTNPNGSLPKMRFAQDARPESVAINIASGNTQKFFIYESGSASTEYDFNNQPGSSVTITWASWSKSTDPTCANCKYHIYRFQEPDLIDVRTAVPWAMAGSVYASPQPLDPFAVHSGATPTPFYPMTDAGGNGRIFTVDGPSVANTNYATYCPAPVSGSAGNQYVCSFTDSASAGTGFSPNALYYYLLVVEDGDGNQTTAKIQRFRSPYYAGDPINLPTSAPHSAPFRTEYRFRRASVFAVNETAQSSIAAPNFPQVMVHVPLNLSGLDHDFYVQKYEATPALSSTWTNDCASAAAPAPNTGATNSCSGSSSQSGNTWSSIAASCNDYRQRLRTNGTLDFSSTYCGTVNASTLYLQSVSAWVADPGNPTSMKPPTSIDRGAFWKGCHDSWIVDGSGTPNRYYLSLPSNSEWLAAADWGDVDSQGVIRQHVNSDLIGVKNTDIETDNLAATTASGKPMEGCNSGGVSISSPGDPNRVDCASRYGAVEMVGSSYEWTSDELYYSGTTLIGLDNGTDGLDLGYQLFQHAYNSSSGPPTIWDFWRAFGSNSTGWSVTGLDPYVRYATDTNNSPIQSSARGGGYQTGPGWNQSGPGYVGVNAVNDFNPYFVDPGVGGGRCIY